MQRTQRQNITKTLSQARWLAPEAVPWLHMHGVACIRPFSNTCLHTHLRVGERECIYLKKIILQFFKNIFITFIFLCVCFCGAYHSMLVDVKGQLVCDLSLLPCGSQGSKSGHQAWWLALLPTELSCWTTIMVFNLIFYWSHILSR